MPLKRAEAKRILDEETKRLGCSFAGSDVKDGPRPGANDLAWWHEHTPAAERSETRYNLAHLRAYVRIAGSDRLTAGGLPLDRQRLWMDRSVISRLERDGYLAFEPGLYAAFVLTERGRDWLEDGQPEI